MPPSLFLPAIYTLLFSRASLTISLQEVHVSRETEGKIAVASKLMWCSAAVDILFLLDGSYSIGKGSFERSKRFAIAVCDALDISPGRVRVGALQFGSTPRLEFPLDSLSSRQEVKESIKRIVFRGGRTETGLALKHLSRGFPGGRNGSVPQILIIITDGKSQGSVALPAKELRERGIVVFAVGVRFPRWEELLTLASEAKEQHVLLAEQVEDATNGLLSTLSRSGLCTTADPDCWVEAHPCERRTLETVRELAGNALCWRGSRQGDTVLAVPCPFYSWKRVFQTHPANCYRTICPGPCDSQPCQNGGTCIPEGVDRYHCLCPLAFGGEVNCGCQAQSLDLVFLLDASASVGHENFAQMQSFIRKCTLRFDVNPDVTQVGLVAYGSQVQTAFGLDTHPTRAAVLRAMSQAPYLGGVGSAGTALLHIKDKVMTVQKGARPGVPKAVVMLTGGSGAEDAAVPAQKLRDNGISVLVMNVGAVLREAVRRLAGPRDSLIHVADYTNLRYHQDTLIEWICREAKRPVNLCKPSPCMNEGTCILKNGSYRCECLGGWEGPHCENRILRGDAPMARSFRQEPAGRQQPSPSQQAPKHPGI